MDAKRIDQPDEGTESRPMGADDVEEDNPSDWLGRSPRQMSPGLRRLVYWLCYAVALAVLVSAAVAFGRRQHPTQRSSAPDAGQEEDLNKIKWGSPSP